LQAEILRLPLGVAAVIAYPVIGPVLQARHRQQADETRRLLEEFRQAGAREGAVVAVDRAGRARHQVARDLDVELQLLAGLQAARDGGQRLQEGCDRLAVGRLLHRLDEIHHRRQRIVADGAGDGGPLFEEGQHRLRAAPHLAEHARRLDVGVEFVLMECRQRFIDALLEDIGHLLEAAIHLGPAGLDLRVRHLSFACVHHAVPPAPTFRRRSCRWRGRASRGCRRRR
jgi:hypothetical protein